MTNIIQKVAQELAKWQGEDAASHRSPQEAATMVVALVNADIISRVNGIHIVTTHTLGTDAFVPLLDGDPEGFRGEDYPSV